VYDDGYARPFWKGEFCLSVHSLSLLVAHFGYAAIFLLMTLESACIPIPSEAVIPYAGYLAYLGKMNFWEIVIIATLANLFGGSIAYVVGRLGGRSLIIHYGKYILLSPKHLLRAESWFAKHGEITILIGRIFPAIRTIISLPAGIAKMRFGKFIVFSAIGAFIWNLALAYLGLELASYWSIIGEKMKPFTYVGVLVLLIVLIWFWFGRRKKSS
jgi:membrane protein DedA with SNARE-associated domain